LITGELVSADFDTGCVRPGDVLLLSTSAALSAAEVDALQRQLRDRLPNVKDVIILPGLTLQGVYREDPDD
jgi:hypothetical protein